MTREDWRERFEGWAGELADRNIYVTIDLDCLREEEAITNWENGLFTATDVAWAIGRLHTSARIIGGDICGAWSPAVYAGWFQRLIGRWDHPRLPERDIAHARHVNLASLRALWPALTGA